ncbi:MAG TPA: ABC transporter substrate-binding protein [Acetobacteraceae bacterium]
MGKLKLVGIGLACVLASGTAHAAGTLRIGIQDDPDLLDPAQAGTFAGRIVFASLCDKLVDINKNLDFVPQLATAWSWSPDSRALTLTLRKGVHFQDGQPFNADAVKANLDRYRSAPYSVRRGELKPVSAVEVVDPQTVRLVLSQPYAPLIAVLSDRAGMMASPKAIAQLGKNFYQHPVCAGPFSFVQRVAQDHITLQRFPGYWNAGAIHLDRIEFRPIADSTVRLVDLRAGQLDLIEEVAPTDAESVQRDNRLKFAKATALGYEAIMLNLGNGPAANTPFGHDPRVRAALEAAIDRTALNQVAASGLFIPDNQSELPSSPYFNKQFPVPPRDVARAKRLLKDAGVNHPTIGLRTLNTPSDQQIGEIIQSMAAGAGIDVKVMPGETNANIQAYLHGDFQAGLVIWSGRSDPDFNIAQYLSCEGFQDWGKYCDPKFQNLLDKGRATTDLRKRYDLYHQLAAVYLKDEPMQFLFHMSWLYAMTHRLSGFSAVPDGLIRPQGLTLQ